MCLLPLVLGLVLGSQGEERALVRQCPRTALACAELCRDLGRRRIPEDEELDKSCDEQNDGDLADDEALSEGQPAGMPSVECRGGEGHG